MLNTAIYSQQIWTDITSTTSAFNSSTNMGRPYIFDVNNDNFPDILVPVLTTVASPYTKFWKLYKNNGNSTFTDVTTSYGLPTNLISTLGFVDYNGDGFKDLYFYTATGLQIFKNNVIPKQ
ncbi:FG-GAP repeat [Flavobacteriaceae bacterium]